MRTHRLSRHGAMQLRVPGGVCGRSARARRGRREDRPRCKARSDSCVQSPAGGFALPFRSRHTTQTTSTTILTSSVRRRHYAPARARTPRFVAALVFVSVGLGVAIGAAEPCERDRVRPERAIHAAAQCSTLFPSNPTALPVLPRSSAQFRAFSLRPRARPIAAAHHAPFRARAAVMA